MQKIFTNKIILSLGIFFAFTILPQFSLADVLLPGEIDTCGELAISGTYTLTVDINTGNNTCFTISSDNVIINGTGHTLAGSAAVAIDARARSGEGTALVEGGNAYTNLVVNDITLTGYTTGINISGNPDTTGSGVNNGYAGDAGDVAIFYSKVGSILADGGASTYTTFGGLGGNITFTDTNLDISNSTLSTLGGRGSVGSNTNGGLDLNYSGTITKNNVSLSALSFFNDNATEYGIYPGGSWPITPGEVSTCGTLYGPGTFTLTQSLTSNSTCFYLFSNNVTLNGAGYSITSATSTNTLPSISAGSYSSFTLASTTISNYSNIITSSSSVTIQNDNLDFSNSTLSATNLVIQAGVLNVASTTLNATTLNVNYTASVTGTTTAMTSALSSLIINSINYGTRTAGLLFNQPWNAVASSRNWYSITSSSDGTKMAAVEYNGYIYTSTDSGATWTQRTTAGSRYWHRITSSSDGTKLIAMAGGGYIYTSTDSGATWTERTSAGSRYWYVVTSSSDGTKITAAPSGGGYIYTSNDSGASWIERTSAGARDWQGITSSSDGTKIALSVYNGYIYTSIDSGATWTERTSAGSRYWRSIASSADGTKMAAVAQSGYIYTSTDSGATWTERTSAGSRIWSRITSSSDGSKLAAVVGGGYIYTSTDSGATWTEQTSAGSRNWNYITSSSDGSKLAMTVSNGGYIYIYTNPLPTLSVDILRPASASSTVSLWSPYVSWGIATSCYYSYNDFTSTSTANCALNGSDISMPSAGTSTLSVRGIDTTGNILTKSVTFDYTNQDIQINVPTINSVYSATSWSPNITYSLSNQTLSACYYSYNNFTSTSTADCSLNGSDILPPTSDSSQTLSIKTINSSNVINTTSMNFTYQFTFSAADSNRGWRSVTSSADGTKLAAVVGGGYIYTSTDSGATWTERTSAGSNYWRSIASSADGTQLAAAVNGGLYISTDSGATWNASGSAGSRAWQAVASSPDGTKLAAAVESGYIYTSTNNGVTWTQKTGSGSRIWNTITTSADGVKMAAAVGSQFSSYIYTTANSGTSWTSRTSAGSRVWNSITSSSDGTILAAAPENNYIYVSTTSGVTWTAVTSIGLRDWKAVTMSSDGTRMAAAAANGFIYISTDSGVTWTERTSTSARYWQGITSSSDGMKLAAVVAGGQIYPMNLLSVDDPYIAINTPAVNSSVISTSWAPSVFWGFRKVSCQYSYDGFATTTNTVDCSNGGSDILAPSSYGTTTLSIRAVNTSAQTLNISNTFTYSAPAVPSDWVSRESSRLWRSAAASSDGTKIAAVAMSGYIYTSTDSGATWTQQTSSGSRQWRSITSSVDGTKLASVTVNGYIYTSNDSGTTWTERTSAGSRNWISVTSSSDGTRLAAAVSSGYIYTSIDSGATWTEQTSAGSRNWISVTSSSDGTKLGAVDYGYYDPETETDYPGKIYTSIDSGATWTEQTSAGSRQWYSVTSSSDGTKLVAAVLYGYIYTSTDSGATWTQQTSAGSRGWTFVTSSPGGTRLAAAAQGGYIYTSTDSGATWTQQTSAGSKTWYTLTSSSDGNKIMAGAWNDYLYTYSNPLPTLSVDIIRPSASSTISSWSPYVSWGIATSCYYSYNDFTSTSTANCALNGTDISVPSAGTSTLSIRGIYATSTVTSSVTFAYTPYYWCGTSDSDWNNASNWYTSNSCSINTGSVPGALSEALLVGSVSPIVGTSTSALPFLINTTGLTGPANTVGIIFASSTVNTTNIIGNVTFNGTSYNTGTITGNAYFNAASAGTFTLSGNMIWGGSISGTVKGGDNVNIIHLIFNNSSSNSATISGMSAVFNGSASNNGTINGDATFNGTTFRMGTVNGTATLNGLAQTISGINNVVNFFKNLLTQTNDTGRDTLYFTSGSTVNVSGLFTLLGTDSDNLLTIRSTNPGSYASLGINGTSNLDFLRIKDIHNTGSLIDLSSKTVFDDEGNSGFTFKTNSTPSSRNSITGNQTTPAVPVSRGGVDTNGGGGGNGVSGILRNLFNRVNTVNFTPIQTFTPLGTNFQIENIGTTVIPYPFKDFKAPVKLTLVQLPSNFTPNVSKFLFAPLPNTFTTALKNAPKLSNFIAAAGVSSEQELASLSSKPLILKAPENDIPPGHFVVKSGEQNITTYATYDSGVGGLAELIKVSPNQSLTIDLIPLSTGPVTATYLGETINFVNGNGFSRVGITSPGTGGRYVLKTASSPIPLLIEVIEPVKEVVVEKQGAFNWLWKWFK